MALAASSPGICCPCCIPPCSEYCILKMAALGFRNVFFSPAAAADDCWSADCMSEEGADSAAPPAELRSEGMGMAAGRGGLDDGRGAEADEEWEGWDGTELSDGAAAAADAKFVGALACCCPGACMNAWE